jgi:hypothetical protein
MSIGTRVEFLCLDERMGIPELQSVVHAVAGTAGVAATDSIW